jgi:hypothetical protein
MRHLKVEFFQQRITRPRFLSADDAQQRAAALQKFPNERDFLGGIVSARRYRNQEPALLKLFDTQFPQAQRQISVTSQRSSEFAQTRIVPHFARKFSRRGLGMPKLVAIRFQMRGIEVCQTSRRFFIFAHHDPLRIECGEPAKDHRGGKDQCHQLRQRGELRFDPEGKHGLTPINSVYALGQFRRTG